MAAPLVGADTLSPVTEAAVRAVRKRLGTTPLFWGRYFKRPGFHQDYQPDLENRVFNAHHMRLLPIARQTARVSGTAGEGAADAILNADALIGAHGIEHLAAIGGEILMFLDVEATSAAHPNLSVDYWIGWSASLVARSRAVSGGRFTILPALYCRQDQPPTWQALTRAAELGFPCAGAWVFRMRAGACTKAVPKWDATFNTPAVPISCPIMLWQFAIDCPVAGGVDFNLVHPDPAIASALLNRLPLPPP